MKWKKIGYCPENILKLIETENRLIVARIWKRRNGVTANGYVIKML